ncbi:Flp pilus assembly protein CpaB [Alkalihalophilus pseudofirmus]|nr:Flp pilus assembly protein CpaB [Alkalihalophilus pseudofirmus]
MNTKKIWMLSVIFGMLMSFLIYIVTVSNGNTYNAVNATSSEIEEIEDDPLHELEVAETIEIEPGKRAISIALNNVQSVSGFVKPGSFVDVIAILPLPTGENTSSQLLLQNVKVLAIGQTFVTEDYEIQNETEMVTLEVSPKQGASLAFAKEVGVVTLMLRGGEDEETNSSVKISLDELVKGKMSNEN